MERANRANSCFRGDNRQGGGLFGLPIIKEKEKQAISPIDAIYCKVCGRTVTNKEQKIAVQGSHTHTFFNPAGIVYELGCFGNAPGCHSVGEATSNFTWFAGYVWCFAICRECSSHLGWFFERNESSFFGLILTRLVE